MGRACSHPACRAGLNPRGIVDSIFAGLAYTGLYRGTLLPVLSTDRPMREALTAIERLDAAILPASSRKIARSKVGAGWEGAVREAGAGAW